MYVIVIYYFSTILFYLFDSIDDKIYCELYIHIAHEHKYAYITIGTSEQHWFSKLPIKLLGEIRSKKRKSIGLMK